MNAFINIFFIFIFIFTILFFRMPDIDNTNYLSHKLTLFSLLFLYQTLLLILSKMKSKCKINPAEILIAGIETATIGVVGYSIYTDLQYYDFNVGNSLGSFDYSYVSRPTQYLHITVIITLLLTMVNTFKLLFGFRPYECIKY